MLTRKTRTVRLLGTWLLIWLLLLGISPWSSSAEETPVAAPLTTDQVVGKMVLMNQQRAEALRSYTSIRIYHVENGKQTRRADLVVKMTYHWPDQKEFTVLSESGSKFLRNHVLKRLVKAEVESMRESERRRKEMDTSNYDFQLVGHERTPIREFYVLEVVPKGKSKFLFQGKIWVDAQDFGIARMDGEPAKNPSWWITKVNIQHSYQKLGDFWLPARNETLSRVRIFGQSLLTIEYKDYELTKVRSLQAASPGEASATVAFVEKE